jgi:hypothetical protein
MFAILGANPTVQYSVPMMGKNTAVMNSAKINAHQGIPEFAP